jgi:hypothetical protein
VPAFAIDERLVHGHNAGCTDSVVIGQQNVHASAYPARGRRLAESTPIVYIDDLVFHGFRRGS